MILSLIAPDKPPAPTSAGPAIVDIHNMSASDSWFYIIASTDAPHYPQPYYHILNLSTITP